MIYISHITDANSSSIIKCPQSEHVICIDLRNKGLPRIRNIHQGKMYPQDLYQFIHVDTFANYSNLIKEIYLYNLL